MPFVFSRFLAWAAGLALLPACWAVTLALYRTVPGAFLLSPGSDGWELTPEAWALTGGAALYLLWHRLRPPEFLYTFAHEMTHLLFALLFWKKVSRLVVAKDSGEVAMSGTNTFITLSPYFFPLLAFISLGAGIATEWASGEPRLRMATSFLTGAALSFHVAMTLRTLATSQPDIQRGGRFFSWPVIYMIGALLTGGAAIAAVGGVRLLEPLWENLVRESAGAYAWSAEQVREWVRAGLAWAART